MMTLQRVRPRKIHPVWSGNQRVRLEWVGCSKDEVGEGAPAAAVPMGELRALVSVVSVACEGDGKPVMTSHQALRTEGSSARMRWHPMVPFSTKFVVH